MSGDLRGVRVFAPATVANIACGFDILGFAVSAPGDEVTVTRTATGGVRIVRITGDDGKLPLDAGKNTASVAVQAMLRHLGEELRGFEIVVDKKMPLGSGMGSSAASAAGALYAVNLLLGQPFERKCLVPFAIESERIACGAGHADNVAPALLGGVILIRSYAPLDVVPIRTPPSLCCALVHPHIEIKTEDARRVLRKDVPLHKAVTQWGNTAGLVAGLIEADYSLISRSLQDVIVEPERSLLIPGFTAAKQAALERGALGCSISGSGPALFALAASLPAADEAGRAMQNAFDAIGIESDLFVSPVNGQGPHVVEELS